MTLLAAPSQIPLSVKISAYIFFSLALLMACFALLGLLNILLVEAEAAETGSPANASGVVMLFFCLWVLLYSSIGYSLLKLRGWARTIALLIATWTLCMFPIGTVLAGVALYLMYRRESIQAFRDGDYLT